VTPSFFVLGAARCGTTSLHYYLDQHPDIAMSAVKEPNFFLFRQTPDGPEPLFGADRRLFARSVADPARYAALFARDHRAAGDVSPLYLYTRETPELIAEAAPAARLVAVLRDPAERAWSHFVYMNPALGDRAPAAFAEAVACERPLGYAPYRGGTHFLRLGRYGEQVGRYLDRFPAESLLVLAYDELVHDPAAALAQVCRFVGVDDSFPFDTRVRYNPGATGRGMFPRLESLVRPAVPYLKRMLPAGVAGRLAQRRHELRAAAGARTRPPTMTPETAAVLSDYYAADLEALERRTGLRPDRARGA
jgi:hypothetical protein